MTTQLEQLAALDLPGTVSQEPVVVAEGDAPELIAGLEAEAILGVGVWAVESGNLVIDQDALQRLTGRHDVVMAQCLRNELTAVQVSEAFAAKGIRHRLLKGAALAHTIVSQPNLRSFRDVDILVPSDQLDDAVATLKAHGATRSLPELRPGFDRRFGKSVTMKLGEVEVDLHRLLAPGPFGVWMRPNDLFVLKDHLRLAGVDIPTLDTTDHFIHACYHVALGQRSPLLANLRDVALLAAADVDWSRVDQTVGRWRGTAVMQRCLKLVEARLEVELPEAFTKYRRAPLEADERLAVDPYLTDDLEGRFAALAPATLRALPMADRAAFARAVGFPDGSDPKERVQSMVERFRSR